MYPPVNPAPHDNDGGLAARADSDAFGGRDGGDYFQGMLDDVRIYDRALLAREVKALYLLGQGAGQ